MFEFAAAAVASALAVLLMIRLGPLDLPGQRSSHVRPTPRGGGVGILAGLGVALAFVGDGLLWSLYAIAVAFGAMGYLDDRYTLSVRVRLPLQVLGAAVAVWLVGTWPPFDLSPFGFVGPAFLAWPLTIVWLVGVMNAVNFMDGLDGLVAGVALVACIVALPHPLAIALAGGLVGFLLFNRPPARIFMGDVGSQPLGFLLACLALLLPARFDQPALWILVPAVLAPFLMDVALTLARRARDGETIGEAHRGHFYQLLQRSGWSHGQVVILHVGVAALIAATAWLLARQGVPGLAFIAAVAAAGALAWFQARRARAAGVRGWR